MPTDVEGHNAQVDYSVSDRKNFLSPLPMTLVEHCHRAHPPFHLCKRTLRYHLRGRVTVHALLDTPLALTHGPAGYRHPWSAILFCMARGRSPRKGGVVRTGRPQCPMQNGRCPGAGSDEEEAGMSPENMTERQIYLLSRQM